MAAGTLTEFLDNLYTTTWQNQRGNAVDQIFDATPFWMGLKERGGLMAEEEGRFISMPLSYAKSNRVKFFGKGATFELSDQEFLTTVYDEYRYLGDSLVRFFVDDQKNRGKNVIINFMNAKLTMSKQSLVDKMEIALNAASPTALEFNSLPQLIASTPTNTVHNRSGNTYTWWRNATTSMTGKSFAIHGEAYMRTMLNDVTTAEGAMKRDYLIYTDQTNYERYEDAVGELRRLVNQKLGDAGFENISFKGVPMVWSPQATANEMRFINLKHLKFKYNAQAFFDMTEWKSIPDSLDRAAQIIVSGNLMTDSRRVHGVLHTIDTP